MLNDESYPAVGSRKIGRSTISGIRKAAILVSFLGEDEAAPLLRNLPEEDLERIIEEIANLGYIPPAVTAQVLEEYQQMMTAQEFVAQGGRDTAVRLLVKAFGEKGARNMVDWLMRPEDAKFRRVDSLNKADPQQLARFLVGEHAQTKSLILAHLDVKQASTLLMKLEPEARVECVRRLANQGQFSPEIARKVSTVLNRRLRAAGDQSKRAPNGIRNVAELMNRLDPLSGSSILEAIEGEDPKLASSIRDLMFTFEDFLDVAEQDMRELMKSIDKNVLMIALKGANDELQSRFYSTMSTRAVEMLKEDSELLGPVRTKDVVKAQGEIVVIARKLEAEGTIVLKTEEAEGYVL